jgi:hypothetical protein
MRAIVAITVARFAFFSDQRRTGKNGLCLRRAMARTEVMGDECWKVRAERVRQWRCDSRRQ